MLAVVHTVPKLRLPVVQWCRSAQTLRTKRLEPPKKRPLLVARYTSIHSLVAQPPLIPSISTSISHRLVNQVKLTFF